MSVLDVTLRSVAVLACFMVLPLVLGQVEHKVMAHMQGRLGPMEAGGFHGWAQLVADGVKFAQKEDVTPRAADRGVFKLAPAVPSEVTLDAFRHALRVRRLDMQASPYDVSGLGLDPVAIETAEGKAEYVARQRELMVTSNSLRRRIVEVCDRLLPR